MHIMKLTAVLIIAFAAAIYIFQADTLIKKRDDPVPGFIPLYELKDRAEREIQRSQLEV